MNWIFSIMLSQSKTEEAFDSTLKDIIISQREKPGYIYQKEDTLQNDLQKETTVVGCIHILCCLMISSFGTILVSSSYSSHLKPAVSTMLMSGYPFVGALCFAITGILSIVSGEKSTKPLVLRKLKPYSYWIKAEEDRATIFPNTQYSTVMLKQKRACAGDLIHQCLCRGVTSCENPFSQNVDYDPGAICSLTFNAVSSVVAGAGLFLLIDSLVALRTASQLCNSEKEHLSSLPYSRYPNPIYDVKNCVLDGVSLTGVLVVMLIFSVLELLLAAYASVFWWKQVYSSNPGSSFSLPQSQDHIKHVKDFFKGTAMSNCWL